jgi:hypothetical protein
MEISRLETLVELEQKCRVCRRGASSNINIELEGAHVPSADRQHIYVSHPQRRISRAARAERDKAGRCPAESAANNMIDRSILLKAG